jgi:heat shock protein HspQ
MGVSKKTVARFNIGQVVTHRRFGYLGVIFDVDPHFMLTEEWYRQVALSRPPRNQPWYHVLVDGQRHTTYVAERHLVYAADPGPIKHPMLEEYFVRFNGSSYDRRGFDA